MRPILEQGRHSVPPGQSRVSVHDERVETLICSAEEAVRFRNVEKLSVAILFCLKNQDRVTASDSKHGQGINLTLSMDLRAESCGHGIELVVIASVWIDGNMPSDPKDYHDFDYGADCNCAMAIYGHEHP